MIRTSVQRGALLALALSPILVLGCGAPSPRTVSGKIVLLPTMKLQDTDVVALVFVPAEKEGRPAAADVSSKDSTFTAQVPPGKYKISFSIQAYPGSKNSEKRQTFYDERFNKAFDLNSTKLEYEVTGDASQSITIDLAQNSVKKD